ncbi:hypothetical protein D3C78_1809270 [compost metagenome]
MILAVTAEKVLDSLSRLDKALCASGKTCVVNELDRFSRSDKALCASGKICVWSALTVSWLDSRSGSNR